MPEHTTATGALAYYARHGAALFPIPAGQKNPTGIVSSFASDCSTDPAVWARWQAENPGCNFGIVAGPSRLVIVDVDVGELGRDRAWQLWSEWCTSHGLPTFAPHVQSARGGWHFLFQLPADAPTLRQIALIGPTDGSKKAVVDLRCGNGFTVAAGSHFEGKPYVLLSDAPPYTAPPALIEHCARVSRTTTPAAGSLDPGGVAALILWLAERDEFTEYGAWINAGMALKIELGDAGFPIWETTFDKTVTSEIAASKWESFATEPTPGCYTINSLLKRAHAIGWNGKILPSTSAMFGDAVSALAASTGATLHPTGVPMLARAAEQTRQFEPYLADFLKNTKDAPLRPYAAEYPQLTESNSGHGLYEPLRECISRIVAMAENKKAWRPLAVINPLAVLSIVNADTFEAVMSRCASLNAYVSEAKVRGTARRIEYKVERDLLPFRNFQCDSKNKPESDNPDNVVTLLGYINAELRWNLWIDRAEIKGGEGVSKVTDGMEWPEWVEIDDKAVRRIKRRAKETGTRFVPASDFLWETLLDIAGDNKFDPAIEHLETLADAWDKTPRLSIWLSATCGVDCDPYHQAASKNIIGGMVKRIVFPGCKHDTMPVFYGKEGTGKSTLSGILADMGQTSLDKIRLGDGKWFTDNVLLGDASKELVQLLEGKTVVEIGEMGMRGSTNAAHVKAMLSRQVDEARKPYDRTPTKRPRRNIFVGTTNDNEPLTDPTGNRRFLPVKIGDKLNLDWLVQNIRQLVGEAMCMLQSGETFELPDSLVEVSAHQEAARSKSDVETLLHTWFAETTFTGKANWITSADLVELTTKAGIRNSTAQRTAIMTRMGFENITAPVGGARVHIWARREKGVTATDVTGRGVRYVVVLDPSTGWPQVQIRTPSMPGAIPLPPPAPGSR